jgi:hypothetical protein
MTPPKAYAGVPKSVPHYADGTPSVDPNSSPFMNAVHGFIAQQGAKMAPQSVSIPNAAANYFVRPANAQVVQPGLAVAPAAPAAPVTASTLMNNAPSALAHAAFGAPGLARPNAAPFTGTVAHGGDNSLTPDPSGDYDVGQVGAPYPSSPQQVALAAQHTGANAAALQNAAGAARDATGNPEQPQNMAAAQHAVANPTQYSPGNFVNLLRGKSYRQIAVLAGALRTAMPYNPQEEAYQRLYNQRVEAMKGMPRNSPGAIQQLQQLETMQEMRAGVRPFTSLPQTGGEPQYDQATGLPLDPATGQPVQ